MYNNLVILTGSGPNPGGRDALMCVRMMESFESSAAGSHVEALCGRNLNVFTGSWVAFLLWCWGGSVRLHTSSHATSSDSAGSSGKALSGCMKPESEVNEASWRKVITIHLTVQTDGGGFSSTGTECEKLSFFIVKPSKLNCSNWLHCSLHVF